MHHSLVPSGWDGIIQCIIIKLLKQMKINLFKTTAPALFIWRYTASQGSTDTDQHLNLASFVTENRPKTIHTSLWTLANHLLVSLSVSTQCCWEQWSEFCLWFKPVFTGDQSRSSFKALNQHLQLPKINESTLPRQSNLRCIISTLKVKTSLIIFCSLLAFNYLSG